MDEELACLAPGGGIGGGGSPPRKRCGHLGGGDGGSQAINTRPAGRFGGTHQAGATLDDYAKPPTHSYSGSAARGGGLAAPHTLASGG